MDLFKDKSKTWDKNSKRVQNATAIGDAIKEQVTLTKEMELMDLGAGTGLLSYVLSPYIASITAVDNSPSMLEGFKEKLDAFACEVNFEEADVLDIANTGRYDGIVSSMTIHHIEDIKALFTKLHALLKKKGFIAIADLDAEDGTFHSDNTGVHHFGFEREMLETVAKEVGFKNIAFQTVSTIQKPQREFTVFLLVATV